MLELCIHKNRGYYVMQGVCFDNSHCCFWVRLLCFVCLENCTLFTFKLLVLCSPNLHLFCFLALKKFTQDSNSSSQIAINESYVYRGWNCLRTSFPKLRQVTFWVHPLSPAGHLATVWRALRVKTENTPRQLVISTLQYSKRILFSTI